MELRVLQYFLAIAREESISGAAKALHLSQPTLSRQIMELEEELGKQLLIRGKRKVTLTEEGMILRRRAEEILELTKKATDEITTSDDTITGEIYIGAGETDTVRFIAKAIQAIRQEYPQIHFHIFSGDRITVLEELDNGLIDFGMIFGEIDTSKYEHLEVPFTDKWGVLMRKDSPLASKDAIKPQDLWDKPLIFSRQEYKEHAVRTWLKRDPEKLNIVATYNLLFNGALMVDEGVGYALCLDKIINVTGDSNLCFKPLDSKTEDRMNIIWKKYSTFTKATEKFLSKMQELAELP